MRGFLRCALARFGRNDTVEGMEVRFVIERLKLNTGILRLRKAQAQNDGLARLGED